MRTWFLSSVGTCLCAIAREATRFDNRSSVVLARSLGKMRKLAPDGGALGTIHIDVAGKLTP